MRLMLPLGAVGLLACLPAMGNWYENFDSYPTGTSMHGVGGWEGWEGDPQWTAYTTDEQARSTPNSLDIVGTADLVHPYSGYDSGQWTYTAWQYVPTDFSGESYFILLNTYGPGVHNWSTQVKFNSAGYVESDFEGTRLPLITGEWVELRVEIDLDADWQEFYYGGQLLTAKSWTEGVSGGGALNIGAVDLFANGATSVFYDDMSLVPEPASCLLLALGVVVGLRRR